MSNGSAGFVRSLIGNGTKRKVERVDRYLVKNETSEEAVARVMLTGILKNQYYRSADAQAKEALPLFMGMAKKDPEYLLKAACFAREANMKGMVKLGLAALVGSANKRFLDRVKTKKAAISLLSTFHPGQLLQFVELCKSKVLGRGLGARPQKWVRAVMENWKPERLEDYTLKYPTALNQLIRLVHPRLKGTQGKIIRYVLDSTLKAPLNGKAHGDKQKTVERLKRPGTRSSTIAKSMLDHQIPWDVIKGFSGMKDPDLCMAMMTQMGLSALLLNIRSLEQHGAFTRDGIQALKMKLDEVKFGRSIPIDFAKPYLYSSDNNVKQLLVDGIVATLDYPMESIEGLRVGVSVDISGSMSGDTLKTAGLLAVPFLKAHDLWFTTFDTALYSEGAKIRSEDSRYYGWASGSCPKLNGVSRRTQVNNLLSLRTGGGTSVGVSLAEAIRSRRKLDLHVIITDEQQNSGTQLMTLWKKYKQHVNSRAELWILNASNYEWHSADLGDSSVTVYQSLTPAIFKNLHYLGQDLVAAIKGYDLGKMVKNNR